MNELSKVGNRAIHELAARKGWQEGSDEKILAHSIFGGLLSTVAGGKTSTGVIGWRRGRIRKRAYFCHQRDSLDIGIDCSDRPAFRPGNGCP